MAKLYVVGIGPGDLAHMTPAAVAAIAASQVVVGYGPYLDLIASLTAGKELLQSGMMKEVERCRLALERAAGGQATAIVSSGDAGIYGMAGLALELAAKLPEPPEIEVIPGVSAVQAAASVLGAPLMHDFAVISLSDLLTPWELIRSRLRAAAAADFVVALYNPRSTKRVTQLEEAQRLLLAHRSPHTPVGIVRNACRDGEEKVITTLEQMTDQQVDMFSLVIIGNSQTFIDDGGRMVTPRGYSTGTGDRGTGTMKDNEAGTGEQGTGNSKAKNISKPKGQGDGAEGDLFSRSPVPGPRSLMFCGTGSDVGKSVLTAGICRILRRRGFAVAPFKSQNMALNSAVTREGGEMGRAQAVQAQACGIPPHTDMNPVLLKPNSDTGSQVIIQGRPVGNMRVAEYNAYKPQAFERVQESFQRLAEQFEVIVMEGAGSIAEVNLKAHDIANLKVAEMANAPVLLVADIDRGGVFAQIVGTLELLEPEERGRIRGVIINKFRGDASLLKPGIDFVEGRTGVPVLGVVPWFGNIALPEEDSVALQRKGSGERQPATGERRVRVGIIRLPRISNYTDFEPLEREPDLEVAYIELAEQLEGLDLVIIPGSKSTVADLLFLRRGGFFPALQAFGGTVLGICGGFQMLGRRVSDPDGVEGGDEREAEGLGLLDVVTVMRPDKETHQAEAELLPAAYQLAPRGPRRVKGYEIHMGETILGGKVKPFARLVRRSGQEVEVLDGAVSHDGRIGGTYLHGIFDDDAFRTAFLNRLRRQKGLPEQEESSGRPDPFEQLADHLEQHLDLERLFSLYDLPERPAGEEEKS